MVTQERLRQLFSYDPDTGLFTRIHPQKKCRVGDVAGCVAKNGYITISVDVKKYYAHRLAWMYVHGYMPEQIDHKNRDRSDNRICNLRPATHSLNESNKATKIGCASKFRGVSAHHSSGMWRARIKVNGKERRLGLFRNEVDAATAYNEAAIVAFGEFAVLNEV